MVDISWVRDQDQANAAIKGARHLLSCDTALRLQPVKDRRCRPTVAVDVHLEPARDDSGYVAGQTPAGDVGDGANLDFFKQW